MHLLREASDPASDPISAGAAEVAGKPVDRVDFVSPHNGRTRLSLDRTSRRIVTVETWPTPQGAWRDRRQWSDYAQSGGLWWPRYESREVDGEAVTTMECAAWW